MTRSRATWALAALLLTGAALRLWGSRWGFPLLLDGDEPHFVDVAVSFGAGTLNPHAFKYPTLWMYVLAAAYGAYYLAWSLFGLLHSVAQFGAMFVWQTWRFHWLGRLLSAGFSCLGLWAVACADDERAEGLETAWPWAAAILAVSPGLVYAAHEAKPDSLMFLLSALAWLCSLRLLRRGEPADYAAAGLCAGLAFAAQYTALPILALPALGHLLRVATGRETLKSGSRKLALALAASAAAFFAGCPFAVLDFREFSAALADHAAFKAMGSAAASGATWGAWANLFRLGAAWPVAALALPLGAALLWRRDRTRLALLALPTLLWTAFLSRQHDGENIRYLYSCAPAIALLSAESLATLSAGRKYAAAGLAALALLPGLWNCLRTDRLLTLPDTRLAATAWIEANIPQGSSLLLDQPDASPAARMTREQAEELRRQNAALGSARARLYTLMRDSHPGGGWRVYHIKRTARDLWSNPSHVEKSQREGAFVDVREGLGSLRALGIRYVVTTSFGARPDRSPELSRFFAELSSKAGLLARFDPNEGASVGPTLLIYRISP